MLCVCCARVLFCVCTPLLFHGCDVGYGGRNVNYVTNFDMTCQFYVYVFVYS